MNILDLPDEILIEIFNHAFDAWQRLIRVNCKIKKIIFKSDKGRCLLLIYKLIDYDNVIKQIINGEIIDESIDKIINQYDNENDIHPLISPLPKYPYSKTISFERINKYANAIVTDKGSLVSIFHQFKEEIIDALSDSVLFLINSHDLFNDEPFRDLSKISKFDCEDLLLKAQNRLCGDIFIYGAASVVGPCWANKIGCGRQYGDYGVYNGGLIKHDDQGIEINYLVSVQARTMNSHCDNWACHSHPYLGQIDQYLPCELFLGLKEGDHFILLFREYELKLTLRQIGYKYGKDVDGNPCPFEKRLLDKLNNVMGLYDDDVLSREDQLKLIHEMRDRYSQSINQQNS